MNKKMILGTTVLSAAVLLLTPLTAEAAAKAGCTPGSNSGNIQTVINGNSCNIQSIIGGNSCNIQDMIGSNSLNTYGNGTIIVQGFGNCIIPGITLPPSNCPNQDLITPPDFDCNGQNPGLPEEEIPDTEKPEELPPNIPGTDVPGTPEENKPEVDKPENNIPDSDNSENNKPDEDDSVTPDEDNTESGDTEQNSYIKQVVSLVNIERAKYGLAPVTIDSNIEKAALIRSREIQKSFSHNRPDGSGFSTVLKETGVTYNRCGENIASGQKTPVEVVNAWMNSAGHRANILSTSFTRIGVGYTKSQSGTGYWVQLFAN